MRIVPVGGETLGVRSMCTFVETKDVNILIDPGLSVVSLISSYPPTPFELRALYNVKGSIKDFSKRADLIVITHYHNDHFTMDLSIYKGREVFVKNPEVFISGNQRRRAERLLRIIKPVSKVYYAEGTMSFGNTKVIFSPIFTHGISKKMGGVVSIVVEEDKRFLYSSDIQGFPEEDQIDFLKRMEPDTVFFDGPTEETLPLSVINLSRVVSLFKESEWVMEHHPFRFLDWREKFLPLISIFEERGVNLKSFSSYLSIEERLLEAERRVFYEKIEEFNRRIW